jgi:hypothetical protein
MTLTHELEIRKLALDLASLESGCAPRRTVFSFSIAEAILARRIHYITPRWKNFDGETEPRLGLPNQVVDCQFYLVA